jgi:hypothetical protein
LKLFPSKHERELFGIIIAFCTGMLVGLLPTLDIKTIFGALATLFAAFIGAYFAYKLNENRERQHKRDIDLASANRAIFNLTKAFNYIASFNRQFVVPIKDDPTKHFTMRPSFGHSDPGFKIDYDSICFLIAERKAEMLSELSEFEELFDLFIAVLSKRNHMHTNIVQLAMEKAGVREGSLITEDQIDKILGNQTSAEMKVLTKELVSLAPDGEALSEQLASKLHKIVTEIFPGENVVKLQRIKS